MAAIYRSSFFFLFWAFPCGSGYSGLHFVSVLRTISLLSLTRLSRHSAPTAAYFVDGGGRFTEAWSAIGESVVIVFLRRPTTTHSPSEACAVGAFVLCKPCHSSPPKAYCQAHSFSRTQSHHRFLCRPWALFPSHSPHILQRTKAPLGDERREYGTMAVIVSVWCFRFARNQQKQPLRLTTPYGHTLALGF